MAFNDEIMVASGEEYDPEHPSTEKATLEKIQSGGTYKTDDPTESTIDNADYFPFYDTSASAKKKTLWSTIVDKIKSALGIVEPGAFPSEYFLSKDGEWQKPVTTNTRYDSGIVPLGNGQSNKVWKTDSSGVPAWRDDANTDTTYTFATGDANGQIKITPSGGSAQNVSVKGLGSAAYETADTAANANTVAKRDSSGYLKAVYFNATNTTAQNIASYTSNVVFQSSDGYFRKTSKANLQSWLGLGSNAYTSTSYLPLSGGTLTGKVASSSTIMSTNKIASGDVLQSAVGVYAGAINADIAGTTYTNKAGYVRICDATGHYAAIVASTMGSNRTITLPNASGKVALTSDLDNYLTITDAQEIGRLLNEKMPISGGTFIGNITVNRGDGTTSSVGSSSITAGNSTASGTAKNSYGQVVIYSQQSAGVRLRAQDLTSARNLYLPASGTALATSASSSARVKENIRDMTEEEARKILDIDVVKFDYKEEYEEGKLDQSGVIAEEVLDIIPEVVSIHPMYDETKAIDPASNPSPTVDYGKFAPYLIKMVQMQQQKIEELEQRLAALEN